MEADQTQIAFDLDLGQNTAEHGELEVGNREEDKAETQEEELQRLLKPNAEDLPMFPPSSVEFNFVRYYAIDFLKEGHDQYVYRHANGYGFSNDGGVIEVDFNVGKSDRSSVKVTGKRKRNAQHFESNTALCKVNTREASFDARCCVKGSMLEVNDRLIKHPELLNSVADREGYIAIIMPKPADWLKIKSFLKSHQEYIQLRKI